MKDILGVIFAFDTESDLRELTDQRSIASVPFGCRYRVIDFMLSNMINAGIDDVAVLLQDKYRSLLDHIGSGKEWDLARKRGGLILMPPYAYGGKNHGYYRGKVDALAGMLNFFKRSKHQYVVLSECDIVANIDLDGAIEHHVESGADITALCIPAARDHTGKVFFTLEEEGRVSDICVGSACGAEENIYEGLGVYIIEKEKLVELITSCISRNLYNFEGDVLQRGLRVLDIRGAVVESYAVKINSPATYFDASMKLLDKSIRDVLFLRSRPIYTKLRDEPPTYYGEESFVAESLIADGCIIEGHVENSIIFRGVNIAKGAVVKNCIIMQDSRVMSGANLRYIMADKDVVISEDAMLAGLDTYPVAIAKSAVI